MLAKGGATAFTCSTGPKLADGFVVTEAGAGAGIPAAEESIAGELGVFSEPAPLKPVVELEVLKPAVEAVVASSEREEGGEEVGADEEIGGEESGECKGELSNTGEEDTAERGEPVAAVAASDEPTSGE